MKTKDTKNSPEKQLSSEKLGDAWLCKSTRQSVQNFWAGCTTVQKRTASHATLQEFFASGARPCKSAQLASIFDLHNHAYMHARPRKCLSFDSSSLEPFHLTIEHCSFP